MSAPTRVRTAPPLVVASVLAVVATGALAGCGTQPGGPLAASANGDRHLVPASYDGRYRTTATVLESPGHGPQLCSAVAESYPPQCSGPDVAGWDWSAVASESAAGTTWGTYRLVGTYAEGTFTLTEPAAVDGGAAAPPLSEDDVDRSTTTCPEPDVDPARTTALREERGGSLCASGAPRSEAELLAVQPRLSQLPGFVSSGPDPSAGVVDVTLVHATEEQQRALDDELGEGLVRLSGVLEPVD